MIPHQASDAVVVRDVTVRYGEVLALRSASLRLGHGTVCALIGVNGSGKSTLLKTVTGLVRPAAGEVLVDGGPPASARRAGQVAYVPQNEDVDWDFPLSVRDVVAMGRYGRTRTGRRTALTRRPRAEDRTAVGDALARVGLAELADRQIGALSGGQRKRAFVARAIAQEARLLLLDEPFAGVDRRSEATIAALLRELADAGRTVLVATHDLQAVPELCDEAALLARTVLVHDTPDVVLRPENLARAFGVGAAVDPGAPR